jgi:dsRNA-specific ribonuclease
VPTHFTPTLKACGAFFSSSFRAHVGTLLAETCLEVTDAICERTCKKRIEARETEVRKAASAELLGWIQRDGRTGWVFTVRGGYVGPF